MNYLPFWPEWTVEEKIGQGSYGTVYKIRKPAPGSNRDRDICSAMKVLRIPVSDTEIENLRSQGMDCESVRSFLMHDVSALENEIGVMISLASASGIVKIEDYYIEERENGLSWNIYIRMELLESLTDYVKRQGSLTQEEVVKMGCDVCDALTACEKQNIIHRDIKPANIFRNRFGQFKLGDFGVAKQMEGTVSAATRVGTPSFEAPEVLFGQKYDHTVDIYGLGIVLYTYLNQGRKPFYPPYPEPLTRTSMQEAVEKRMNGQPVPPIPFVDHRLSQIVQKACEFQPSRRYQTAAELKHQLEAYWFYRNSTYAPQFEQNGNQNPPQPVNPPQYDDQTQHTNPPRHDDQTQHTNPPRYDDQTQHTNPPRYDDTSQTGKRQQYRDQGPVLSQQKKPDHRKWIFGGIAAAIILAAVGIIVGMRFFRPADKPGQGAAAVPTETASAASTPEAAATSAPADAATPTAAATPTTAATPTAAATPTPTAAPTPTAVPTPVPADTWGTPSSLYPDGENVTYTAASYSTSAPDWSEYDQLITESFYEFDMGRRAGLLHRAEDILMGTGAVVPLYYYNDVYLQKPDVNGIFTTPFGFKHFKFASSGRDVLKVCLGGEPYDLDPAMHSSTDDASLIVNLFEGLYTYNADGQLEPALCESYEVSEDGLVYTFHLKDGLLWSDGTRLTAHDFEYSWKRACAPETGAAYSYLFDCFAASGDTIDVTAVDDRTLVAKLSAPCPYFLDLVAFPAYFPVPESQVAAAEISGGDPGAWVREAGFVTSGAFTLNVWNHNSNMILEKNPNYYRADEVSIKTIDVMLTLEDSLIAATYDIDELDFSDIVPNNGTEFGEDLHVEDNLGTYYAEFNVNSPLFEGKTPEQANAMRKAISLLIDRRMIVEIVGMGNQKPATSFVPAGMADGNGGVFKQNTDAYTYPYPDSAGYYPADWDGLEDKILEEARSLLEFAGYEFTDSGVLSSNTPLRLTYLINDGSTHVLIAEMIQQNLSVLGIDMELEAIEWAAFLEKRINGQFDFARGGWIADYNDPVNMLEMWTSWSGNNDCQFGKRD